jgi:hypothetical protein
VEKYDYINPTVLDLSNYLISSDSSEAIDLVSDKKICLTPNKSILSLLKDEKIRQKPKQSVLNFFMSIEDSGMNNSIKFVEEEVVGKQKNKSNSMLTKADLKKKKQKVLNKWLSQMKPNPHFLSVLNEKLAKQ